MAGMDIESQTGGGKAMVTHTQRGVAVTIEPTEYMGRPAVRATFDDPTLGHVVANSLGWGDQDGVEGVRAVAEVDGKSYTLLLTIPRADYDAICPPAQPADTPPTRCTRCVTRVDRETAPSQMEWGRLGSTRVRVRAYYCDACYRLLTTIGRGERSAMQDRAAAHPDFTPDGKQDCE